MRKEVQELVQGEAGIDDEEETKPMPMSVNLAKEELILSEELSIPPLPPIMRTGPFTWRLARIPEVGDEEAIVKGSVTSALTTQESKEGMEASGFEQTAGDT